MKKQRPRKKNGSGPAHPRQAPAAAAEAAPAPAETAREPAPAPAGEAAPAEPPPQPGPPSAEQALRDQLLRLQADFENWRRRTQRERLDLYQRANEDLILELLPVLDHFEIGFENAAQHEANPDVVAGFRMVFDQALAALAKFKLQPFDAVGEVFDPHRHEAMTQLPSPQHPEGVVMAQTRRGYLLGDRLLRAAQVVVSAGPGPAPAPEPTEPAPTETKDEA